MYSACRELLLSNGQFKKRLSNTLRKRIYPLKFDLAAFDRLRH